MFASVPAMKTLEMEMVMPDAKKKIWGAGCNTASPPKWPTSSIPWCWGEVMPPALWEALLSMLCVGAVIDVSPSPALATTAMKQNITYHGICQSQKMAEWMGGVVDRAALKSLALK